MEEYQNKPDLNALADDIMIILEKCKTNEIMDYGVNEKFSTKFKSYENDKDLIKSIIKRKNEISDYKNNYIYLIAHIIDACYSTQVKRFNEIYKICDLISEKDSQINKSIEQQEIEKINTSISKIVNIIKEDNELNKKPFFSFVTKYFALHAKRYNPESIALPIYDKYVQMYIESFFSCNKGEKCEFDKNNVDYLKFYKAMEKMLDKEDSKKVANFDQFDNKIWFTAKCLQFKIAEENLTKNDLQELLDEHLKLDLTITEDKYIEKVIRNIKNSYKNNNAHI